MNSKASQKIIIVGNIDNPLPDQLNGEDTLLHQLLPAYELTTDEEGSEVLGDAIANGTYRQRLACAHLTRPKVYGSRTNLNIIAQMPRPYNPASEDLYGQPIPVVSTMEGRSFYLLNMVGAGQNIEKAVDQLRLAWETATGQTINFPEGHVISELEVPYHFAPVES